MSSSVVTKLILKDLYLSRAIIIGGVVAGLVALAIAVTSRIGFAVGGIMFISSIVTCGILVAAFSVSGERKEKALLFALSLPISTAQYARAKLTSVLLGFLIPWVLLTGAALLCITVLDYLPQGMLVYALVVQCFFLALFCLFMVILLSTTSEGWMAVGIVGLNLSISFFMMGLGALTSIPKNASAAVPVWSAQVFTILGCEAAAIVLAFVLILYFQSRKRDFV